LAWAWADISCIASPLMPALAPMLEAPCLGDLHHVRSVALGLGTGSLTWVERHDGAWWGMFANYDGRGGEAPRATATPPWSVSTISGGAESWALLAAILERIAPMSISGGRWGPDGRFYLSRTTTPALCRRDPAGRRRARPCGDPGHGGRGSGGSTGTNHPRNALRHHPPHTGNPRHEGAG